MTVSEILEEIRSRAGGDTNLGDALLLTKINNEYDQTNLRITNLNEDYFYEEDTITVTISKGPYDLPTNFLKIRGLYTPTDVLVDQVSPVDPNKRYGWHLAGTTVVAGSVTKSIKFTDTPREAGTYTLKHVASPPHLDTTTNTVPIWPDAFHEVLILGALKRLYSVEDIFEKFGDLSGDLKDLRDGLLAQVGGLNLGADGEVQSNDDWK